VTKAPQPKPPADRQFHAVSIDARGQYFLDGKSSPLGLGELKTNLRVLADGPNKDKIVIRIRGDQDVPFGKVMTVLDELKKLNLMSVTLDGQTGN